MSGPTVAVWGYGRVAQHHAACLRALGLDWVAVTRDPRNARRAERDGASATHADLDACFGASPPDAIVSCLPVLHVADGVHEAVRHGVPVLTEKPVGLSPSKADAAARAADDAGCPVMVGLNRRFYSVVEEARERITRDGLLGIGAEGPDRMRRVIAAGVHPEKVLDRWLFANVIHVLDLVRFLGGEPTDVHSLRSEGPAPFSPSYASTFRLPDGALGHYSGFMASPGSWGVDVYQDGRRIRLRPLEEGAVEDEDGGVEQLPVSAEDVDFKPGFMAQMRHFIDGLGKRRPAYAGHDLRDHLKTMDFVQEIFEGRDRAA